MPQLSSSKDASALSPGKILNSIKPAERSGQSGLTELPKPVEPREDPRPPEPTSPASSATSETSLGPGSPEDRTTELAALFRRYQGQPAQIETVLDGIHQLYGFLPERILRSAQQRIGFSLSDVYRLILANPQRYQLDPPGRRHIKVCLGPSCSKKGSAAIRRDLERRLDLPSEETTPDGELTLQTVYCCGFCSESCVVVIDNKPHTRLHLRTAWHTVREQLGLPETGMAVPPDDQRRGNPGAESKQTP